jgi:hypothetical protein
VKGFEKEDGLRFSTEWARGESTGWTKNEHGRDERRKVTPSPLILSGTQEGTRYPKSPAGGSWQWERRTYEVDSSPVSRENPTAGGVMAAEDWGMEGMNEKTGIVTEASKRRYSASLTMGERMSTPDASASPFEASSMTVLQRLTGKTGVAPGTYQL